LSSAFLQVELEPECRKFTACLFDNQVFQFTRIPYGLRNSLPGFIPALNMTLGTDTSGFALSYVDDLVVYSPTFDHHLRHLETVTGRLTKAGFTINANKCRFCRPEITFLGHVINNGESYARSQKIEAILNYPRPKNVRQLKQFLGVCNYHHRYILNYAEYVAPLLRLLKQGCKWKWTHKVSGNTRKTRVMCSVANHR
jgi:hypothetical protein